jgi:hypothetical protein
MKPWVKVALVTALFAAKEKLREAEQEVAFRRRVLELTR